MYQADEFKQKKDKIMDYYFLDQADSGKSFDCSKEIFYMDVSTIVKDDITYEVESKLIDFDNDEAIIFIEPVG